MEEVTDEPLYRDRVCGIDIGKAGMAATIRVPSEKNPARRAQETREFATTKRGVLGLAGAVRDYADGLNGNPAGEQHFQVTVQEPEEKLSELPAAIEVAAYRIAAEALTNITRHAMAHHCTVSFSLEENGSAKALQLKIVDDGIGLSDHRKAGVGLNSMRERAEEVGGTFKIESFPQKGTCLIARFPLVS